MSTTMVLSERVTTTQQVRVPGLARTRGGTGFPAASYSVELSHYVREEVGCGVVEDVKRLYVFTHDPITDRRRVWDIFEMDDLADLRKLTMQLLRGMRKVSA